ncbi:heme ABC exporter ATP-binding protein CcmA [Erythrobacter sp. W53]|uniref:heme ABC exporter ATP-binding protein CcmA n=1 Tax=Erythrobacter sp. W53 TaxID=3425947 RepID=UPI003D76789E
MQGRLVAKNLSCQRGGRLLFAGVSFELGAGDALHVTGANGIGKSSMLRQLAGLLPAFSGDIERSGSLALLDERLALDEHASLAKALEFWEQVDGCKDPRPALDAMGITDLLDIPVRYLSTGQRKRATFARLLNSSSDIWLLDEPLNGLDTNAQEAVEAEIVRHCADGGICIAASHQAIALPGEADENTLPLAEFTP